MLRILHLRLFPALWRDESTSGIGGSSTVFVPQRTQPLKQAEGPSAEVQGTPASPIDALQQNVQDSLATSALSAPAKAEIQTALQQINSRIDQLQVNLQARIHEGGETQTLVDALAKELAPLYTLLDKIEQKHGVTPTPAIWQGQLNIPLPSSEPERGPAPSSGPAAAPSPLASPPAEPRPGMSDQAVKQGEVLTEEERSGVLLGAAADTKDQVLQAADKTAAAISAAKEKLEELVGEDAAEELLKQLGAENADQYGETLAKLLQVVDKLTDPHADIKDRALAAVSLLETLPPSVAKPLLGSLAKKLGENKTDESAEKLANLLNAVDKLTDPKADYQAKALAVAQVLQSLPAGVADRFIKPLAEKLQSMGIQVEFKADDKSKQIQLEIVFAPPQGGKGIQVSVTYDAHSPDPQREAGQPEPAGTFKVEMKAGVFGKESAVEHAASGDWAKHRAEKAEAEEEDDEKPKLEAEFAGSVAYEYAAEAYEEQGTYSSAVDLEKNPKIRSLVEDAARAAGIDPKDASVHLQADVGYDGKVSFKVIIEAPAKDKDGKLLDPPRFHRAEVGVEADLVALAEDAAKALLKKFGPAITEKILASAGVEGLAVFSKAVPVAGQLVMAAQIGWEVGRFMGENISWGTPSKTLDEHTKEMWQAKLEGKEGAEAELEGRYKAGVAVVVTKFNAEIEKLQARIQDMPEGPEKEMAQKQIKTLETLRDVRILELAAVGRPELLTTADRDAALKKVDELVQAGVLTAAQAHEIKAHLGAIRREPDADQSQVQEQNFQRISHDFDARNRDCWDSGAKDNARAYAREVVQLLHKGQLTPQQAEALLNQMHGTLTGRGISRAEADSVLQEAMNPERSTLQETMDTGYTSNTAAVEVGVADWAEKARQRLHA